MALKISLCTFNFSEEVLSVLFSDKQFGNIVVLVKLDAACRDLSKIKPKRNFMRLLESGVLKLNNELKNLHNLTTFN